MGNVESHDAGGNAGGTAGVGVTVGDAAGEGRGNILELRMWETD
jgi:hypothetical protein